MDQDGSSLFSSKRKSPVDSANQKKSRKDSTDGDDRSDADNVPFVMPPIGLLDFTLTGDTTYATLIVEGKQIRVGRDFLALHSPYFTALLKGDKFAEASKEEKEIKDVSHKEFTKMLRFLHDPTKSIEAEDVEALLTLGDRFVITNLVDHVEDFLIETSRFSVSAKLLLADRYRLIRLQTLSYDSIGNRDQQTLDVVKNSAEFGQLSDAAKRAFTAVAERTHFPTKGKLNIPCGLGDGIEDMSEVTDVVENGFAATGVIAVQYEKQGANAHSIHLGGLIWTVSDDSETCEEGEIMIAPCLVINRNRPTSADWSVEGFVEVAVWAADISDSITREQTVHKTFAFSMSNACLIQQVPEFFISCGEEHTHTIAYYTIKITKIAGVRNIPRQDLGNFSNVTLVVEEQNIHVNRQYLSTISTKFHEMLSKRDEVELKNAKYNDVVEFLQWVYPSSRRHLTVTSLFSVLRIAQQFEVKIDTSDNSPIMQYLLKSHKDALLPEKMIFHFEFGCGLESDFDHPCESVEKDVKLFHIAKSRLKKSPVFAAMTPEKKVWLYEWMIDDGFRLYKFGFPSRGNSEDSY